MSMTGVPNNGSHPVVSRLNDMNDLLAQNW